jgi:hypothetical protein
MDDTTRKEIIASIVEWADENEYDITFLGGGEFGHTREEYADAIVGTTDKPYPAIVYLRSAVIQVFVEGGMSIDEAIEWYEHNTERALPYVKVEEGRPIIVDDVMPF